MTENILISKNLPLYILLLISFLLSSLIVIEHKDDIPIKDEAEFYKASVTHSDSNDYSYYGGEYGGAGSSRVIVNPTWHPAGYTILLRGWQSLTDFTFSNARLFGVLLLGFSIMFSSVFFYKNHLLNKQETLVYVLFVMSMPILIEGALLLDIDGTALVLCLPLYLLLVNKYICVPQTLRFSEIIFFSIFFSTLLLFKLVAAIPVALIVLLYLLINKSSLKIMSVWLLTFVVGSLIFLGCWKLITNVTDLDFTGPFGYGKTGSAGILQSITLSQIHLYTIRDFLIISGWLGFPILIKIIIDGLHSLLSLVKKLIGKSFSTDRFHFLRFAIFIYFLIYLVMGRIIIYEFPKYILPVLPLVFFLVIYDSKRYVKSLFNEGNLRLSVLTILAITCIYYFAGDQVEIILEIFKAENRTFQNHTIPSYIFVNLSICTLLFVLITYYCKYKSIESHAYGLFSFTTCIYSIAFGIALAYSVYNLTGSITYDYKKKGALEAIEYVNSNYSKLGTLVGPLEVVYNIKGKKYIFDGVFFSDSVVLSRLFEDKPLTLILTQETKKQINRYNLLDKVEAKHKYGSYEIYILDGIDQ